MNKTGCVPSKRDLRDYKLNRKVCNAIILPDEFELTRPQVRSQGNVNSCVAHAVAESLEQTDGIKYSTDWVYGYRPFPYYQGEGMMISNALKTVRQVGAVEYKDLPTNTEVPEVKALVKENIDTYKQLAGDHKIYTYARLHGIQEIKNALYTSKQSVIIAINTGDGLQLDENNVAIKPSESGGGHAVLCYGWNRQGLLIQNSWGKRWGKDGTFILPYNYGLVEAWVMLKDEQKAAARKPALFFIRELITKIVELFAKK